MSDQQLIERAIARRAVYVVTYRQDGTVEGTLMNAAKHNTAQYCLDVAQEVDLLEAQLAAKEAEVREAALRLKAETAVLEDKTRQLAVVYQRLMRTKQTLADALFTV